MDIKLNEEEVNLILNVLPLDDFLPKVMNPMFYHTLSYEGDLRLQEVANNIRKKLNISDQNAK